MEINGGETGVLFFGYFRGVTVCDNLIVIQSKIKNYL